MYREKALARLLGNDDIMEFLGTLGYEKGGDGSLQLDFLRKRMNSAVNFPHEIGIFLGYPLEDVKSFIEKKGEDCLTCGEWKVYHDEQSAEKIFHKLTHCKEVYLRLFRAGKNICDMTVSA